MLIVKTLLDSLTAQAKASSLLRQHYLMDDLWSKINEVLLKLENSRVSRLPWGELYDRPYNQMADSWDPSGTSDQSRADIIKENISHYCEATIDHSQLSYQEKEDQKRQMKQTLEVYIQGVKDEMRATGRLQL